MKYINRTNDFAKVISSINNYDITYILSGKAFGLTSFMQELGKRLFQYHVFTLNTINGVNVANLLVSEIMHSDERKKFKKMAEQELGEKSITLLAAIFQGIPYAGPTLAQLVEGKELPATCGHGDQRLNTRDMIGKEYELSGSSVGRLLKLNDLIKPFKDMVDRGALYTNVALQLAFLPEEEQDMVFRVMNEEKTKITSEMVANLRSHSGSLTEAKVKRYLSKNPIKKKCYKVPARIGRSTLREWIQIKLIVLWSRHWLHGLERRMRMFDEISLKKIDAKYFNIILLDNKDITLQSRNTGHYWYLHCTEYPEEQSLIIFHKHFFRCPYHQHGKANTLNQAVRSIKEHDKFQLEVRKCV